MPGHRRRGDGRDGAARPHRGHHPAIESAHALAGAVDVARELARAAWCSVNLSGRGDKDMDTAMRWFGLGDA